MGIRRSLATVAVAALVLVGSAGAAGASSGDGGRNGVHDCGRVAAKSAHLQRDLDRIDRQLQATGSPGARRTAKFEQRKVRVEQKLQALQAACQA